MNGIPTIQEPVQTPIMFSEIPKVNGIPKIEEPAVPVTGTSLPSIIEPGLFDDTNLISPAIASSLPSTYNLRCLRRSDYYNGFLDVLRVLTTVGDITEEQWNKRFDWMCTQGKGGYYLLVIEDLSRVAKDKIVATGALIVERKL
jgi:glucosamine-phosphate N-acetyltransferase